MGVMQEQEVLTVKHWTDSYFSFTTTRPSTFRFTSGEFVMIGLNVDGKVISRAYSVASPSWADELEFFSIKVPDGPLTSKLQLIKPGDKVLIGAKSVGTLVMHALKPGKRLHLLGTGTGLAPWLSIVQDPETYELFETIRLDHTVRQEADLAYKHFLEVGITQHEFIGPMALEKFHYTPAVTRSTSAPLGGVKGRVTDRIKSGHYEKWNNLTLNPEEDRIMICGSMSFNKELVEILTERGFTEGAISHPGDFVIERAFVG